MVFLTFLFQLCEWEFSLVQVHGTPQLATVITPHPQARTRELLALPPYLHYHSEVAGLTLFIFPISMVTCSQTSSEERLPILLN